MHPHIPRRPRRWAVPAAALSALLLGLGLPAPAHASGSGPETGDAARLLSSLSSEQLQALHRLSAVDTAALHFEDRSALESGKPVDVIVRFRQPPATAARLLAAEQGRTLTADSADRAVRDAHTSFTADLAKAMPGGAAKKAGGGGYTVHRSYTRSFDGVGMTLPGDKVAGLLALNQVAAVWPDAAVHALDDAQGGGAAAAAQDGSDDEAIAAGLARLHAEGVTGKGVKVGIIDTGIDYRHPDLKDAYAGGYDFVDDDADPMETTYADWKASGRAERYNGETFYTLHGTHVAGIVAGGGDPETARAAHGVAPGAKVYAYRVLGPYGSGSASAVLAGMDRADQDGMDVVNMSLGSAVNDPLGPESVAADTLVLDGVTTVIAAGNSGPGAYSLGSPGAAALPLTVGANDSPLTLPSYTVAGGGVSAQARLVAQPYGDALDRLAQGTYPVADAGTGTASGYAGKDVTGKAVLVRRGGISLDEKVTRARSQGAAAVLLVNDNAAEGHIPYYLGESATYAPAFSLTAADGAALEAAAGASVSFAPGGDFVLGGDGLADFSSRGPAYGTNTIKPEVTAPGVSILSSVPADVVNAGGAADDWTYAYERLSGTSMATPYVAGAAALLLQHDPRLTPDGVRTALMNTARPLEGDTSVFDRGAGRIDPYAAVHATASVDVAATTAYTDLEGATAQRAYRTGALDYGTLPLGEAYARSDGLQVRNDSGEPVRYTVAAAFTRGSGSSGDAAAAGITLTATPRVTVGGHGRGTVRTRLQVPASAPAGLYEGELTLTPDGAGHPALHVPFGMRVVKTGLARLDMTKPVLSTSQGTGVGSAAGGQAQFDLQMAGQLDSVEIFLDDASGNDIGYIGYIDTTGLTEGVLYGPADVKGYYHPLTGRADTPVDPRGKWPADGHYKLRVVGRDAQGGTYPELRDIYVDSKAPSYTDGYGAWDPAHPTVVERPVGTTAFDITGTLHDNEADAERAAGIDIGQGDNALNYSTFSPVAPEAALTPDANGRVSGRVSLPTGPPVGFVKMWPTDAAGNIGDVRLVNVIDAGRPYVVGDASAESARPGDLVTYTLTGHNLQQWTSFNSQIRYDARNVAIVSVETAAQLARYGPSPVTTAQSGSGASAFTTASFGVAEPDGISGASVQLLKVTYRVLDGAWTENAGLNTGTTGAVRSDGTKVQLNTQFYGSVRKLNPTSTFIARPAAEALLTPGLAFDPARDYSADGITATLTAPDGTRHVLTPDATGRMSLGGLPPTDRPYRLEVRAPGHFTWYEDVDTALRGDWGTAGTTATTAAALVAGDVNGDDVVDVRDAAAVYAARGTADRAADIDHDGVVGPKDLHWVVTDYLMQNSTADHLTAPVTEVKGKTLEDYVALTAAG
ncbi:S8 family serine peptidase [Streptomyces sp. NRRL F-5123]|uniref:S8 family serine peptidase n=1 Tax=Streptomyces sp. NRRL F-5123 TaxID=1463856 RepID=UPI0004E1DE37|nr:S8 family serine peptidase [Streptomyces sp. NRRL F-5123]